MTDARSPFTGLSVADRLSISDLLTAWNWAVDAGDAAALRTLCIPDILIDDNGTCHSKIESFLLAQAALGPGTQRWTDHARLSRSGDEIVVKSLALITVRHAMGGTGLVWSGHSHDLVRREANGWRFVSRILRPWNGEILASFPLFAPLEEGAVI